MVTKVLHSLNAAFVNVGASIRPFYITTTYHAGLAVFLSVKRTVKNKSSAAWMYFLSFSHQGLAMRMRVEQGWKISDYIKPSQPVLVQIAREYTPTKASLTTDISIAELLFVVLLPFTDAPKSLWQARALTKSNASNGSCVTSFTGFGAPVLPPRRKNRQIAQS